MTCASWPGPDSAIVLGRGILSRFGVGEPTCPSFHLVAIDCSSDLKVALRGSVKIRT
jgi:hypothetical protein